MAENPGKSSGCLSLRALVNAAYNEVQYAQEVLDSKGSQGLRQGVLAVGFFESFVPDLYGAT